jgi:hypothetical protein
LAIKPAGHQVFKSCEFRRTFDSMTFELFDKGD